MNPNPYAPPDASLDINHGSSGYPYENINLKQKINWISVFTGSLLYLTHCLFTISSSWVYLIGKEIVLMKKATVVDYWYETMAGILMMALPIGMLLWNVLLFKFLRKRK